MFYKDTNTCVPVYLFSRECVNAVYDIWHQTLWNQNNTVIKKHKMPPSRFLTSKTPTKQNAQWELKSSEMLSFCTSHKTFRMFLSMKVLKDECVYIYMKPFCGDWWELIALFVWWCFNIGYSILIFLKDLKTYKKKSQNMSEICTLLLINTWTISVKVIFINVCGICILDESLVNRLKELE